MKMANRYFENTFYADAIPIYEEISKKSPETLLKLADAYCLTFQPKKAVKYYRQVATSYPEKIKEFHAFRFVQTLKALGNYTEAGMVNREFLIETPEEIHQYETDLHYLENVKAIGKRYEIKNLGLNTPSSEFGATVYQNKLVFAAARKKLGLFDKMFRWNASPYLDLYVVPIDSLTTSPPKLFSENLTTDLHESNAVFSPDGKTVFFTRNNFLKGKKGKDADKVTHLKIYKAEWNNGKWTNVQSLPVNDDAYSVEHPALSPDGKTLYFASDMPGGFGGFDLYKMSSSNFRNPVNLGPQINTAHKEQFPFVDAEGNLYFASDGHPGFGFLDIFISTPTENSFEKPDNVGLPVNSGYDDFAFYIDPISKNGYFSSNRPQKLEGKGSDDIYKIHQTKPLIIENCFQVISGKVIDETTGKPLPFSTVVLSSNKVVLESLIVSENAQFEFKVNCEKPFRLTASKPKFRGDTTTLNTTKTRKKEHQVVLELLSEEIIAQRKIQAQKTKAAQIKAKKARIQTEKAKQKVKEQAAKIAKKKARKEHLEQIIAQENAIVKEKNRILIKTEPIYFDYDLWYIRKESREVLDKVIAILEKYPQIQLEIGTHTDVRGTDKYNQELSKKRSASVMDYFIGKGIEPERLTAKGYGEKFPIIQCIPEDSCNEAQHEINRRCEFVIKGFQD